MFPTCMPKDMQCMLCTYYYTLYYIMYTLVCMESSKDLKKRDLRIQHPILEVWGSKDLILEVMILEGSQNQMMSFWRGGPKSSFSG